MKRRKRKILNLKWRDKISKFLFDSKCSICGKEVNGKEIYLCEKCRERLENDKYLRKRKNVYYLFQYDGDIKKLIIDYKLNERKRLSVIFAELISEELKMIIRENKVNMVIPVPASKEKLKKRGFNQVELILDKMGIDYKKMHRDKNTIPMYKIKNSDLRKLNIKEAFSCDFSVEGKNILIVDDIITTGATMKEMIIALNKNGKPKNIFIFSICASKKLKFSQF